MGMRGSAGQEGLCTVNMQLTVRNDECLAPSPADLFLSCSSDNKLMHSPLGSLLMTAKLRAGMGSYRDFKSPWIGRPAQPPDVYSFAVRDDQKLGTVVHVSWNGATEVARWKLWHSDSEGRLLELLTEVSRQGFETVMRTAVFACYVLVEAVDNEGASLGKSRVTETIISPEDQLGNATMNKAFGADTYDSTASQDDSKPLVSYLVAFMAGVVIAIAILGLVWSAKRGNWKNRVWWSQRKQAYEPLPSDTLDVPEDNLTYALTRQSIEGDDSHDSG